MKKVVFLFAIVMAAMGMNAQIEYDVWATKEYVDDFGDPTGDEYSRVFCDGVFSNSATVNSDLTVSVIVDVDHIRMSFYEYDRASKARIGDYDGSLGTIKYKLDDGTTGTLSAYAPKSGGLFFSKERFTEFKTLMDVNSGKTIKFSVIEFDCSGSCSSYKFVMVCP